MKFYLLNLLKPYTKSTRLKFLLHRTSLKIDSSKFSLAVASSTAHPTANENPPGDPRFRPSSIRQAAAKRGSSHQIASFSAHHLNNDGLNFSLSIFNRIPTMSEKKPPRAVRVTGKSPIAQPPRAAIQGRSKTDHLDDNASTKSAKSTPDTTTTTSDTEDDEVKEKDKRIAELEKELATMEDEFERELTQLSHKLTNESETAIFWQQKHSSLNQTFLKTDTDVRLLRAELSGLMSSREERDRDIKTRISSLMLDRDAFREAYNEAMGELRGKDDMIKALQGQVWGLKSFVSSSGKMDEQVTDEAFGERMQRLGNGLQNWVITGFRRAKIGMLISLLYLKLDFEESCWLLDLEVRCLQIDFFSFNCYSRFVEGKSCHGIVKWESLTPIYPRRLVDWHCDESLALQF